MYYMCLARIRLRNRQNQQADLGFNHVCSMKTLQSDSEEVALEVTRRHQEEYT